MSNPNSAKLHQIDHDEEPMTGATKLRRWNADADAQRDTRFTAVLVGMSIIAVVLAIFAASVFRPFASTGMTILCIGPSTDTDQATDPARPTRSRAIRSSEAFHDFATGLATANTLPAITIAAATGVGLDAWMLDEMTQRPMLVHLVGAAVMDHGRAFIVPHRDTTSVRPASVDIAALVEDLAAGDNPCLLVIDAVDDRGQSVMRLPEFTAWQFNRVVSDNVARWTNGNLLVVVSHCQSADMMVAENDQAAKVTPMTARLQASFSKSADSDGDGSIVVKEWVTAVAEPPAPADTTRWFASSDFASWQDLKISPIHDVPEPVSETVSQTVTLQDTATVSKAESPITQLDVMSPSMAMADRMFQAGIATEHSERAAEVAKQLEGFLGVDDSIDELSKWLQSPAIEDLRWDEVEWARVVVRLNLPAAAQKQLIQARVVAMRLSCDSYTRQVYPERWDVAQWTRIDAERNATSPVRSDSVDYIGKQAATSLSLLRDIHSDVEVVRQVTGMLRSVRGQMNGWIARPVFARSPSDDAICKLLSACVDAKAWLDRPSEDTTNTCREHVARIDELVTSIKDARHASHARNSGVKSKTVGLTSNRFLEITSVRVQRAKLALHLEHGGTNIGGSEPVDDAADNALSILGNPASPETSIDKAITGFRMAVGLFLRAKSRSPDSILHERVSNDWVSLLRDIAADASRYSVDATMQERDTWIRLCDRCRQIAVGLGGSISANVDQSVHASATLSGSLAISPVVDVEVHAEYANDGAARGYWSIEQDSRVVSVESMNGEDLGAELWRVGDRVTHQVRTSSKAGSHFALSNSPQTLRFRLRREGGVDRDTAINVRWINADGPHRISIPLQMPLLPIADIESGLPSGGDSDLSNGWVMHANRTQHRLLRLNVTDPVANKLSVRLLAWPDPNLQVPPPMRQDEAIRWLGQRAAPQILASIDSLSVSAGWRVPLVFPPKKVKPTDPAIVVGTLVCELTDPERKIVQMIDLRPQVHRPSSLVAPTVSFDHEKRVVEVELASSSLVSDGEPAQVSVDVCRESTGQVIANETVAVSPTENQPTRVRLSTANANGESFLVRMSVDGWRSAFVYKVAGDHSVPSVTVAEDHAAVQLLGSPTRIVSRSETLVKAKVLIDVTDHLFRYGIDEISLGLDINGDRFLTGEPQTTVRTPMDVRFDWAGIEPDGSVGIRSRVGPHELGVPYGVLANRRIPLLATLRRGDVVDYSQSAVVVLDRLPPKIERLEIRSPLPTVAGSVVQCDVVINDAGLSEAGGLVAGWAINGRQDFSPETKKIPGQQLVDGRWTVSVPTDGLASGQHTLLVQATDHAGNVGDVTTLVVPVQTAAEIQLAKQNATTVVRGSVSFVKLPVSDMTVTLQRQEDPVKADPSNPPNPSGMPNDPISLTSKRDLKTTTGSDGKFVIPEVTSGRYELIVEGLYQGVRRRKTVKIAVQPPQPTTVPNVRVD